jgi:hypothetical protein
MRTTVNGQAHGRFTRASSFQHVKSDPLVRITANFAWRDLADGTPLKATWYYNQTRFFSSTIHQNSRGGNSIYFLRELDSRRYPDGRYTIKISVNGGPTVGKSIRVSSTSCTTPGLTVG